jgi:protocatechuate 4,5-dioxygenase beta chain
LPRRLGALRRDGRRARPRLARVALNGRARFYAASSSSRIGLRKVDDGKRAGFLNKTFDLMCMEKIVDNPEELAKISTYDLIREAGAQGLEFILWLAMRGCLGDKVKRLHQNYHIPISNTAAGALLLENAA